MKTLDCSNGSTSLQHPVKYRTPGMRRTRLLVWEIFNRTPLHAQVTLDLELSAARHCKLSPEQYFNLKAQHPRLWANATIRRQRAVEAGQFPPQPAQLKRWRVHGSRHKRLEAREARKAERRRISDLLRSLKRIRIDSCEEEL
ncbi:MAG: hypothetical protein FJ405_10985 [Verrucomicrobia bacterium]|nr:hypothetical protein [Verrucomicrobiota bacterium]